MKTEFDFIVIGTGLAGLTSALVLKEKGSVLLISKSYLTDCATNLAQGGIAAVVTKEDNFSSHIKDTLAAGAYHNDRNAVKFLVEKAPSAIFWLEDQGVKFEKKDGLFNPTKEAAHSCNRVLHITDFTGREIEKSLILNAKLNKKIHMMENSFVLDLLVRKKRCYGVQIFINNKIINLFSRATVLATGGTGQLYKWTTNPGIATGDGLGMAYRAGLKFKDIEFIQFHPTALKHGRSPLFLLSEALRGEGAYIVNEKGERFVSKIDPRGEMAPRDIVARAIYNMSKESRVFLDIRHKGKRFLKNRFPNIYKELLNRGLDLSSDLIPISAAAHYTCGGIEVDLSGRTKIANLFAFGEVSRTGVHGANRLASNSLLEAVVFPRKMVGCIADLPARIETIGFPLPLYSDKIIPIPDIKPKLQELMWEKVGIIRRKKELQDALEQINQWEKQVNIENTINQELAELKNMLTVSKLIVGAALKRKGSLGAHFIEPLGRKQE